VLLEDITELTSAPDDKRIGIKYYQKGEKVSPISILILRAKSSSSSSSSNVVIYTQRLKTTATRCWRLDQTNTSSTSGRKFRLWSRTDGHPLANCSRIVVRRQRTPDRQAVCLW